MRYDSGLTSRLMSAFSKLDLTVNEYKVLYRWYSDHKDFIGTHTFYAKDLNLRRQSVSRAFKGLVDKEVLFICGYEPNGKYRSTRVYKVNSSLFRNDS